MVKSLPPMFVMSVGSTPLCRRTGCKEKDALEIPERLDQTPWAGLIQARKTDGHIS